ncbi:MAG: SPFH domain-containing protein [Thermoanaerobaculia bacterium]
MSPELFALSLKVVVAASIVTALIIFVRSFHKIGPTEVGLVMRRFSGKQLTGDNPIAFKGEAGYQAELLMPGVRWKLITVYSVRKFPWVQIPAGQIGVVIAQIGNPLPIGAKSARYKPEFGNFTDLASFVSLGGQKGVQRPVLPPGTLVPMHPVAFLVITKSQVYGVPVSPEIEEKIDRSGRLSPSAFGLDPGRLEVVRIQPLPNEKNELVDMIGIVTTYEGDPLESGDIASRLGGFQDIAALERTDALDGKFVEAVLASKNNLHNNYQDFEKFLQSGGKIGLQHDPLLYGAYTINPFLVSVEMVPMLIVQQGQTAVIKAYLGLPTEDLSGSDFKFGSLVRPGHRGIWQEPLRTGKYAINPRCYQPIIVPTSILTLNWANAISQAHNLDANLSQIIAKSREGFVFKIDLQVQIHVPDTKAPRVISIVGSIQNLVNEVLQAAVGNHFRDKLQSMSAVAFIEKRQEVQLLATAHIREQLKTYEVETPGVYIQDVELPAELVEVLREREIAKQQEATYTQQQSAQKARTLMEAARGTADMQVALAQAQVNVTVEQEKAKAKTAQAEGEAAFTERMGKARGVARTAEADGEAAFIQRTGDARGAEVRSVGLAKAESFQKQKEAVGPQATALLNLAEALGKFAGEIKVPVMPHTLITGGGDGGIPILNGVGAALMSFLEKNGDTKGATAVVNVAEKK